MFDTQLLKQKKLNPTWWVVIAVVVAAVILMLTRFSVTVPTPPIPVPTAQPASTDTGYLAEYDPNLNPALAANVAAEDRPIWEIGLDVILKLAIVLGLVYVALHGLRWLQRNKAKSLVGGGSATINVLETAGLAPGRSLHLVVVGEKTLLLGATDHQISVLVELTDTVVPIPETDTTFERALAEQQQQAEAAPQTVLPLDGDAAEYDSDWQTTLTQLRSGIRQIQQTVGG